MASGPDRVCLGIITAPHGVRGALKVKSFTDQPEDIARYGALSDEGGTRDFTLRIVNRSKAQLVVKVDGIEDRNAAEALKGTRLYVPRAALPKPEDGEFYHADLVGLRAEAADGTDYGTVRAIHDFGAGDLLELELADGRTLMLPFTQEAVPTIDLKGGRVVVAPPEGFEELATAGGGRHGH